VEGRHFPDEQELNHCNKLKSLKFAAASNIYENMKSTVSIPVVVLIFQHVEFKLDKIIMGYKKQGIKCVNNHFIKSEWKKKS
jgi:hypothetical protein